MTLDWTSTSRAEDASILALSDASAAARTCAIDYRIIGGNMAALHGTRFVTQLAPRATTDADTGITANAVAAAGFDDALRNLGYHQVDGSRYIREAVDLTLIIDVLVSDVVAGAHNVEVGPIFADAAPGLALALARPPFEFDLDSQLTSGERVRLSLPVPDTATAVLLKCLAWGARYTDSDALDTYRLLEIWSLDSERIDLVGEATVPRALRVLRDHFMAKDGPVRVLPPDQRPGARRLVQAFVNANSGQ